jgi:hypothetical protein
MLRTHTNHTCPLDGERADSWLRKLREMESNAGIIGKLPQVGQKKVQSSERGTVTVPRVQLPGPRALAHHRKSPLDLCVTRQKVLYELK